MKDLCQRWLQGLLDRRAFLRIMRRAFGVSLASAVLCPVCLRWAGSSHSPTLIGLSIAVTSNLLFNIIESLTTRVLSTTTKPPRDARFLILMLMPGKSGLALLSDLAETFQLNMADPEQGPVRASLCYWGQVIISLLPLAWDAAKKIVGLATFWKMIK